MNLYIEIGNTNTKFCLDEVFIQRIPTGKDETSSSIYNTYFSDIDPSIIVDAFISSVVPSKTKIFIEMLKEYFDVEPILLEYPIKTGIKIQTDNPKEVGADLIALAAFVASKTSEGIIVNVGTATTIMRIKDKTLMGVIIAPGLMSSINALTKNAAQVGEINNQLVNKQLGKNTQDAINIGAVNGHAEMIKGLVSKIEGDNDLFLSGGDAKLIRDSLTDFEYVYEATIKGLIIIGDLNEI